MLVTAWNNGDSVFGIRVGRSNREESFDKGWENVDVEMDGDVHRFTLTQGFWKDCPEFRDQGAPTIREWLRRRNALAWPPRNPPKFWLHHIELNRFSLTEIPTQESFEEMINWSMDELVQNHYELLDLVASERSVTHQLALILRSRVPWQFQVDVEYNRHQDLPKVLDIERRVPHDDDVRAVTVYPDLIVHVRNTDEANLLVVEVKKPGESLEYDQAKLVAFRRELGYLNTAHLVIGVTADGSLVRQLTWVDA